MIYTNFDYKDFHNIILRNNKKVLFVILTGYSRCGKDTAASMLRDKLVKEKNLLNKEVAIRPLAFTIKKIVSKLFNIKMELLEKIKNDNLPVCFGFDVKSVREILNNCGKVINEEFNVIKGSNYFVNEIVTTAFDTSINRDLKIVIIPDMRFKNEMKTFLEWEKAYPNNIYTLVVKVKSNLRTCIKVPGIDDEVDEIVSDFTITVKENDYESIDKQLNNILFFIENSFKIL